MDRAVLDARLVTCRETKAQRLQQDAQLRAALQENANQINALIGREAELVELLALPEEPDGQPVGD